MKSASAQRTEAHPIVQLRYAPLPFIGALAVHCWFVVFDSGSGRCDRWEVWQTRNAGGMSFDHVHRNLKTPDAGVGGGPYRVDSEWTGEAASAVRAVLDRAAQYPYRGRYRAWPGPNSNTFVAWVLHSAGIAHAMKRRALGRNYARWRRKAPNGKAKEA